MAIIKESGFSKLDLSSFVNFYVVNPYKTHFTIRLPYSELVKINNKSASLEMLFIIFHIGYFFIEVETNIQHSILPRPEVITRLRDRNEPITLFGESEVDAFRRLRKYELLEPEVNKVSDLLKIVHVNWGKIIFTFISNII